MKISVNLEHKSYDIFIKQDIIKNIANYHDIDRKVLVLTDENVSKSYLDLVMNQLPYGYFYVIEGGENSKSLENFEKILTYMLENNFGRKDMVLALGGGVIGDLAGFVAASYMRGIEYISIPTSTLSMIDSSIGGKTAVNLGKVKNIVGAFHHPSLVLIDINTLKTLEKRHVYAGLVEALKSGLIYDKELYEMFLFDNFEDKLEEIIQKSLMVKKDVVEKDEKEQHLRKILNLGHTIGHGIESFYDFKYYHGECVAMGMIPMITNVETREKVKEICKKMGIDTNITYDADKVFEIVKKDKKANKNTITIVTVEEVGTAILTEITLDELFEIVKGDN